MKTIWLYIKTYTKDLNLFVFLLSVTLTGILIFFNYSFQLEKKLTHNTLLPLPELIGHVLLFGFCFLVPYLFTAFIDKTRYFKNRQFIFLAIAAILIFSLKVSTDIPVELIHNSSSGLYWNKILYWPVRLVFIILCLVSVRNFADVPFYGLTFKNMKFTPYFLMLLMMIPLIAFASTQHDFLITYPKLKSVLTNLPDQLPAFISKLIFELSYGSDFFSIELFFRGFLVFAFVKYAGKDAILPMACFYCSIHFGKPLFECISSFWGGLLLGIISYNNKTITGGLIIHLGIAWMMELGGYLGNALL